MPLAPPVLTQGIAFTFLALTGCALGLSFDLYRALRSVRRMGRLAGDLADGAYGLLAAALVAAGLLGAAWGEVRLYSVLALAAGGSAYFLLASPLVLPAARRGARAAHRLIVGALRLAWRPVRWCGGQAARGARTLAEVSRNLPRRRTPTRGAAEGPAEAPQPPSVPARGRRSTRPRRRGRGPGARPPR